MINGVNFQPGLQPDRQAQPNSGSNPSGSSQGVQEAIKVLSLRLPKVVGANAVAPSALLQSQGSGGNSRVDSIVESVLRKYFPQAAQGPSQPQGPIMPSAPTPPVNIGGSAATGFRPQQEPAPSNSFWSNVPRVVADVPPPPPMAPLTGAPRPNTPTVDSGGFPNGLIAPLPDLRKQMDWLPSQPDDSRDRLPEI